MAAYEISYGCYIFIKIIGDKEIYIVPCLVSFIHILYFIIIPRNIVTNITFYKIHMTLTLFM